VRSKNYDAQSANGAAASPASPGAGEAPAAQEAGPGSGPADDGLPAAGAANEPGEGRPAPVRKSRRSLKNWRVRSRLVLLIIIPTVAAVVFGGVSIASGIQSAQSYQRVENLATLYAKVTGLAQALQDERQDAVTYIVLGLNGGRQAAITPHPPTAASYQLGVLTSDATRTAAAASQVSAALRGIGSSYPALAQQDAARAATVISDLPDLLTAATKTKLPALVVIQEYDNAISSLLAIDNEVAVSSSDSTLAETVRAASLLSQIKEEAAEQRAILTSALSPSLVGLGVFGPSQLSAITTAQAEQVGNAAEFDAAATASQRALYNNALSGTTVARALAEQQQAINDSTSAKPLSTDPTIADAVAGGAYVQGSLRTVERRLVDSIIARSRSLRDRAITYTIVSGIVVLLLLALALILTVIVGRSLVRPLQRLRRGALQVAGISLPEAVRRMNESDGAAVSLDVQPIDVDSADEIGEVARAFDQVHREALRLAANEAALRGNVNAMFVNLSRRSQSLVERQIRLIDELEQGEQDAERLSSLFQMDHLATRMRRNSENLLVLAGHDVARRWNQPVSLVDVLRAAVSEIEQYERVTLNVQPGISVRGQAVSDVVHLTAELVENATAFSPADSPVSIVGHLLNSGGVLVEIADQGVGMGADEMAHANWRLDNPPVVDVAVSRRMGLFVVARLAFRHGIRIRLRTAPSGGLNALVWLPDEVVVYDGIGGTGPMPADRRFDPAGLGAAAAAAAGTGATAAETAAAVAGPAGWDDGVRGDEDRAAAEEEVNAARAPRFAPLRADAEDTALGARRIPGAGPRPGSGPGAWPGAGPWAGTTGPLPMFRTSPQPRADAGPPAAQDEPAQTEPTDLTAPQPTVAGSETDAAASESAESTAEFGGLADERQAAQPAGTNGGPVGAGAAAGSGSGQNGGWSILGAPIGRSGVASPDSGYDWSSSPFGDGVVVPPAGSIAGENRLPIFEAVESDWFRRGRPGIRGEQEVQAVGGSWSSAADEGWRAAEAVSTPMSAGVTEAGLPKRVPQANLVPGSAAAETTPAQAPTRSAAATRERLASFQRGIREARAGGGDETQAGEDEDPVDP
jgi:signal transduction histidine kinase